MTKTCNPATIALIDRRRKADAAYWRAYRRARRAFAVMEKARRLAARLTKILDSKGA